MPSPVERGRLVLILSVLPLVIQNLLLIIGLDELLQFREHLKPLGGEKDSLLMSTVAEDIFSVCLT